MDIYCKSCCSELYRIHKVERSEHFHEFYLEHREKYIEKANRWQREHPLEHGESVKMVSKRIKNYLDSFKTHCVKCKESRHYVLDFHHIDPSTKECNFQSSRVGFDVLRNELTKVICLCANCHREFHHRYGIRPKKPIESLSEYLGTDPYKFVCLPKELTEDGQWEQTHLDI